MSSFDITVYDTELSKKVYVGKERIKLTLVGRGDAVTLGICNDEGQVEPGGLILRVDRKGITPLTGVTKWPGAMNGSKIKVIT